VATIDNSHGITLIELILSLGLVSLILTTALTLFSTSQKAYEREDVRLYSQQNARQAFLWLSTSLKLAKNVDVISEKEIKMTSSNGEQTTFYFQNGILYRKKNSGINPIAELSNLQFLQSNDGCHIDILISVYDTNGGITIKTKVTPFGNWIN